MTRLRKHSPLVVVLFVTAVASGLSTMLARQQLNVAANSVQASFNAWDLTLSVVQDPYLIAFFTWPLLIVAMSYRVYVQARPAVLLRHGSRVAFVLSQTIAACGLGFALGTIVLSASLLGTRGLSWALGWSPLALAGEEVSVALHAQATAGLFAPALVAGQLVYLASSAALLGAGVALFGLFNSRFFRPVMIALVFSGPLLFKAWPFAHELNPFNAISVPHAVANKLPLWLPPAACFALVGALGATAWLLDRGRRPTWRAFDRRWGIYAAIVIAATLLLLPRVPQDMSIAYNLLYGADRSGLSFVHWAYTIIVWLGLTFVVLTRWSTTLTTRLPYLLLRYGGPGRMILRAALGAYLASFACVVLLLFAMYVMDWVSGRPNLAWIDAMYLLIVGPLGVSTLSGAAVGLAWISQHWAATLYVLLAGMLFALPSINPLWPWPTALPFLGARIDASLPSGVTLGVATAVVATGALLVIARRSIPQFES